MSSYDLIPDEVYSSLPDDPTDQFVTLVRVAQSNLQRLLDDSSSGNFADEIRSQFMAIIAGTADALGISGLEGIAQQNTWDDYSKFQVVLAGITAKARLRANLIAKPFSVELGRVTKAKIRQEVDQLRVYIEAAELTAAKKAALNDLLDDLLAELDHRRLSFARTMAIAAAIMGAVGGSTTAIANAPKIPAGINFIISLIGIDKEQEDTEIARLASPPKALTASKTTSTTSQTAWDADDNVPF